MPYLIVQPGDTLQQLSKKNHVSLQRLLAVNPQIHNPNNIFPGQVVILPLPHQRRPSPEVQRAVRPGDTMFNIAREFGVPLNQVIALNPQVNDPNLIYPGMILTVRRGKGCPHPVVDLVNRFMGRKAGGGQYDHRELVTLDASQRLDPRILTGIANPSNQEYDFLSCHQRSHQEFIALVALYRRRRGSPGIHDIVIEQILVTMRHGEPKIADINVQLVLQVS